MIEIITCLRGEKSDGRIFAYSIDGPQVLPQPYPYSIDIFGWIVLKTAEVCRIKVVGCGVVLQEGVPWTSRPDVVEHIQTNPKATPAILEIAMKSGFHLSVSLLGMPAVFSLEVIVCYEDGAERGLATLTGRRDFLIPKFQPVLQPLITVHLGRSGSTWLMHLLAQHPQILVHQRYPFESVVARHALRVAAVLGAPHSPPVQRDLQMLIGGFKMGPLPQYCEHEDVETQRWFRTQSVERHAEFALESIDAFHLALAARQGLQPRYFAEKAFMRSSAWGMYREFYPRLRSLFLVRDFRDICCSRYFFSRDVAAGRKDRSWEEVIRILAAHSTELLEAWRQLEESSHLIKYEELAADPALVLTRLFHYLDLDASPGLVQDVLAQNTIDTLRMARHQTSGSTRNSLQRWKRDMTPEQLALANELGAPMQQAFGYI